VRANDGSWDSVFENREFWKDRLTKA